MRRIDAPEILDSDDCPPDEVARAMQDLGSVNRRFGGVATTCAMLHRVALVQNVQRLSLLEVAAGNGEVPSLAAETLARHGVIVDFTLLDRARSHLPPHSRSILADALSLPFCDDSFDVVSCNLFAHHLDPSQLTHFVREGLRVSRRALLINDLVRHRVHLALVYASRPLMRSRISWRDGITSVRRAYLPIEIREIVNAGFPHGAAPRTEISRHFLFRMGVIVWKANGAG